MANFKILCDINENINFIIGGVSREVDVLELTKDDNLSRIYRIQFSKAPLETHLSLVVDLIEKHPNIELRFYGAYEEELINWKLLSKIESLSIDLWETKELKELSTLRNLKKLTLTKNVKSAVSLSILENLTKLEKLYTSISKGLHAISKLLNLRFLSLREIKSDNLDFIIPLKQLEVLWLSLGSYDDFGAICKLPNLKKLSVHQVRGFDNNQANEVLSRCKFLVALQLQQLKHIHSLNFLKNMSSLKNLQLDGIKNIESYNPVLNCDTLEDVSTYNSKPLDKSLKGLIKVKSVGIGDSYPTDEISKFMKQFEGEDIWIRGRELKGSRNYVNQFDWTEHN